MKDLVITQNYTPRSESINDFLKNVNKYKLLTLEEEHKIFEVYSLSKSQTILNEIVNRNLRFVISVAKQYMRKDLDFQDLLSAGCLGLIKAAHKFDHTKGFKFTSYSVWYIRAEIILHISNESKTIRIPISTYKKVKDINIKLLANEELLKDEETLINLKTLHKTSSLNDINSVSECEVIETIADEESLNPFNYIMDIEKTNLINRLLLKLNERERFVIIHTYGINKSSVMNSIEMAEEFKISSSRVIEIKNNGLWKIKRLISKLNKENIDTLNFNLQH